MLKNKTNFLIVVKLSLTLCSIKTVYEHDKMKNIYNVKLVGIEFNKKEMLACKMKVQLK